MLKFTPLQFYNDKIFLLQFLGRDKDNGVRRSVVSGKKVCLFLCSGDVLSRSHPFTSGFSPCNISDALLKLDITIQKFLIVLQISCCLELLRHVIMDLS